MSNQHVLPTTSVILKESGDKITINTTDFDPDLHEKIVPRKKLEKAEKPADQGGADGKK